MSRIAGLHEAKKNKNDEFYTRMEDINSELMHYEQHFKGKTILMNCDDPTWSNFWRYFHLEFERLGLKKIISTHYEKGEVASYKMEYEGGNDNDIEVGVRTDLEQNGDFRSPECVELLKEADIVVTNPPFSLFSEYISLLMKYDKKFIIIGNLNAITYKEVFPWFRETKLWLGVNCGDMAFRVPADSEPRETRFWIDENGQKWRSMGNIAWYTNLDIKKQYEWLETTYLYSKKDELYPDLYPKYENYDAINVDKVSEIPMDYEGVMGVPITFLYKYNPEQFEIIGISNIADTMDTPIQLGEAFVKEYRRQGGTGHVSANTYGVWYFNNKGEAKVPYARILIRKKI